MIPLLLLLVLSTNARSDIKPISDVVREFGYDLETHIIHTSDHYKLTVHRLLRDSQPQATTPGGDPTQSKSSSTSATGADYGVPVLLVEGILQSSASNLAKGNGIAYSLADEGYDVWLSNYRGNLYSREHEDISPDQPAFWNFTLHEMGTKDLPAVIDYILDETHRHQLIYLGFSMGTTMFWILTSTIPAYQSKVAAMVAVGPVARPSNMAVIGNIVFRNILRAMFNALWAVNACEIMPYGGTAGYTINLMCTQKFHFACENFLNNMNYLRDQELRIDSAFKLIPYSPAGISTKVIIHFIQIAGAKRFQQFDYGTKGNQEEYGAPKPPEYDLKKINLPIYFVHSDKDEIATTKDVEWLAEQLPHKPERKIESVNNFRHIDFSLNTDLENLLTRPLMSLIIQLAEEHSNSLSRVTEDSSAKHVNK